MRRLWLKPHQRADGLRRLAASERLKISSQNNQSYDNSRGVVINIAAQFFGKNFRKKCHTRAEKKRSQSTNSNQRIHIGRSVPKSGHHSA